MARPTPAILKQRARTAAFRAETGLGRQHRKIQFRPGRLPGKKKRPGFLEVCTHHVKATFFDRSNAAWTQIASVVPVGHGKLRRFDRVRALRSQSAEAIGQVLQVLLTNSDLMSGFCGKPRGDGQRWERLDLRSIAQLAFDEQDEAAVGRVSHAIGRLMDLRLLAENKQVRFAREPGVYRSEANVRRLHLDRIAKLFGLKRDLARDRKHLEKEHPERKRRAIVDFQEVKKAKTERATPPRPTSQPTTIGQVIGKYGPATARAALNGT